MANGTDDIDDHSIRGIFCVKFAILFPIIEIIINENSSSLSDCESIIKKRSWISLFLLFFPFSHFRE